MKPAAFSQLKLWQQIRSALGDSSAALLFPTQCRVCGASVNSLHDGVACQRCWQAGETARLGFDCCVKCDASLPRLQLQSQARRCGQCDELAFTYARACGHYAGALREAVLQLKMQPQLCGQLRQSLSATFWQLPNARDIELIVPVPLHPTRERERSFNQAELIARVLSRAVGLPVNATILIRTQATERHRAGMDAKARQQSLHRAFAVRAPRMLAYRTALLVDDVMTTGATAHEIAQTLCQNGARGVSVLTLARATGYFQ